MTLHPSPPWNIALRVFLPFASGYFLSYLFRVVNAVIAPDLVTDLKIDPAQLGLLTSIYFIAFASSQLPLGILLDRFGPRITESLLLIFAGIGAFVFATSRSLEGVIIGRALIGFGVSACLMAAFKSYVLFFPERSWPRINGLQMAAGGLGALSATAPVEWMLKFTDWRGLFLMLAAMSLIVALAVFFIVPEKKSKTQPESFTAQAAGLKQVFTSSFFWRIAPLTTLSQSVMLSLQGLWAGPWMRDVAGLSRADIAGVLFWTALAMVSGYILMGFMAERLSRIGISVLSTSVAGMTGCMLIQGLIAFKAPLPALLTWVLFGFLGTSGILAYAALTSGFSRTLSGRVTTSINLLVFVAAFILQWAIGAIIQLWEIGADGGYHPSGYRAAFLSALCLQTIGLIWFLISGCRKTTGNTPPPGNIRIKN